MTFFLLPPNIIPGYASGQKLPIGTKPFNVCLHSHVLLPFYKYLHYLHTSDVEIDKNKAIHMFSNFFYMSKNRGDLEIVQLREGFKLALLLFLCIFIIHTLV